MRCSLEALLTWWHKSKMTEPFQSRGPDLQAKMKTASQDALDSGMVFKRSTHNDKTSLR
jgi:hypothetical protein